MNTQQQSIIDALSESGWMVLEKETSNLDWWAAEIWAVKSSWSPQDCLIYLTFLVDPQWEGERKATEGIWAVKASVDRPKQGHQNGEIIMSLGRGWEKRLRGFLQELTQIRNGWPEAQAQANV
jgi:hypothetical protein